MPELPEVETIRLGLSNKILHKKIKDISVLSEKSFLGDEKTLINSPVLEIKRRAKNILFVFPDELNLLIHLKMTGQLIYIEHNKRFAGGHPSHDWHDILPNSHTRVIFTFNDGSKLYFNDLRKFGWCKILSTEKVKEVFSLFGPEPFSKEFNVAYFKRMSARFPSRRIKQFIMDQTIIAGIGNIYADESLFLTKIHPATQVQYITEEQWRDYIKNIKNVLELSIKHGGTTDSDYVNSEGKIGGMQNYLKVYHKTGRNCPSNCGGKIERIIIGGRGTNYCPNCQKEVNAKANN